jgi:hypothetical protein
MNRHNAEPGCVNKKTPAVRNTHRGPFVPVLQPARREQIELETFCLVTIPLSIGVLAALNGNVGFKYVPLRWLFAGLKNLVSRYTRTSCPLQSNLAAGS